MRKIITAVIALSLTIGGMTLTTSCNKKSDWNCKCTIGSSTNTSIIKDKTRKEAKAECNKSGSLLGVDYDCKLQLL